MEIVTDKLNARKPQPTPDEEPGFFGSFWDQKAGKLKAGAATVEAVSMARVACYCPLPIVIFTSSLAAAGHQATIRVE